MFESILLEKDQEELLSTLVEAVRNVPREQRQKFAAIADVGDDLTTILHPGLTNGEMKAYIGHIEALGNEGLISISHQQYVIYFDVLPLGFKLYEHLKQRIRQPLQQVEAHIRNYLNTGYFQQKYPSAYQKWSQAEAILWSSDSVEQSTTIGHFCREAMQEFADIIVKDYNLSEVDNNKAHTVARIRTILESQIVKIDTSIKPFVEALLTYWGTVSDIIQRQEHGGQKEGEVLVWDDGRRVVFHTAIVMLEISNFLTHVK